jgi:hypothetical protein
MSCLDCEFLIDDYWRFRSQCSEESDLVWYVWLIVVTCYLRRHGWLSVEISLMPVIVPVVMPMTCNRWFESVYQIVKQDGWGGRFVWRRRLCSVDCPIFPVWLRHAHNIALIFVIWSRHDSIGSNPFLVLWLASRLVIAHTVKQLHQSLTHESWWLIIRGSTPMFTLHRSGEGWSSKYASHVKWLGILQEIAQMTSEMTYFFICGTLKLFGVTARGPFSYSLWLVEFL